MDSGGDKQVKKQREEKSSLKGSIFDVGTILQSFWVRCRTVFPNCTDGKFMESELRFVLYCGFLFWALYLIYEAIK